MIWGCATLFCRPSLRWRCVRMWGALWENFCVVERRKFMANQGLRANTYFWRTYDQKEIDYIEERDGVLTGFECKWNPARQMRSPREFLETYPGSVVHQIDRDNYWRYLL